MFCVKCGKEIKDGSKFCPECGTPVEIKINPEVKPAQNLPKKEETKFDKASKAMAKTVNIGKGIAESIAVIVVVILVFMALTGKLDDAGEEIGNAKIFRGNDTKSGFADNSVVTAGDKQIQTVDTETEVETETTAPAPEPETEASVVATPSIQPLSVDGYAEEYNQIYMDYMESSPDIIVWYAYYDIDADGVPEMFLSQTEGDNTTQYGEICTIENGSIKYYTGFDSNNVTLYVDPSDGKVVSAYDYMGTEVLTYITKTDAGIEMCKQPYRELGEDEEMYSTPYMIESLWVYTPSYDYNY